MTLAFDREERVGPDVVMRWVYSPGELHEGCEHGPADVMMVSIDNTGLWVCATVVPEGCDATEAIDAMRDPDGARCVALCVAALGQPWSKVTHRVALGQLALLNSAASMPAIGMLATLDPSRVLDLREVCGSVPGTLAALRLMADYRERSECRGWRLA